MGYVIGTISSFVNEDQERCESPVVQTASDGRSYTVVILNEKCDEGVEDFSDGEAYSVFATAEKLNPLSTGKTIRVYSK